MKSPSKAIIGDMVGKRSSQCPAKQYRSKAEATEQGHFLLEKGYVSPNQASEHTDFSYNGAVLQRYS